MGRPTKTSGSPIFYAEKLELKNTEKEKIIELLGIDWSDAEELEEKNAERILRQVALLLTAYPGNVKALDKAPRAANYIQEIGDPAGNTNTKKGLYHQADKLLQTLCNDTSQWIYDAYEAEGYNIQCIEKELASFINASNRIIENKKSEDGSQGRNKNIAFRKLINSLNLVFNEHYSTPELDDITLELEPSDKRTKQGKEIDRENFIALCLEIADISYPKNWATMLIKQD